MIVTIELTEEQEAFVTAMARRRGVTVRDVVAQLIDARIGVGVQSTPPSIATDQGRLHTLLHGLLARSDTVERQPSALAAGSAAEAAREKYSAQGLRV